MRLKCSRMSWSRVLIISFFYSPENKSLLNHKHSYPFSSFVLKFVEGFFRGFVGPDIVFLLRYKVHQSV